MYRKCRDAWIGLDTSYMVHWWQGARYIYPSLFNKTYTGIEVSSITVCSSYSEWMWINVCRQLRYQNVQYPVQIPSGGDVSCTWRTTQDWIKRTWKYSFRVIKVWKSCASAIGSKINKFNKPINPWEARDILKAAHYLSHRGSVLYKKWHVLTASSLLLSFMELLVTELCGISIPSV